MHIPERNVCTHNKIESETYIRSMPARLSCLRASSCKYREWGDSREISDFFIFCPNNLYSELLSKIPFKDPEAL